MEILKIGINDRLVMKKKHPCGSDVFTVLRLGSDIKIRCSVCGRDLTIEREKLEKMTKKVVADD